MAALQVESNASAKKWKKPRENACQRDEAKAVLHGFADAKLQIQHAFFSSGPKAQHLDIQQLPRPYCIVTLPARLRAPACWCGKKTGLLNFSPTCVMPWATAWQSAVVVLGFALNNHAQTDYVISCCARNCAPG
jgi:hypothetical protein